MGMLLAFMSLSYFIILSPLPVQGSAAPLPQPTLTFPTIGQKRHGGLSAAPQSKAFSYPAHVYYPPRTVLNQHKHFNATSHRHHFKKPTNGYVSSPTASFHRNHWKRNRFSKFPREPYDQLSPLASSPKDTWHAVSPSQPPLPSAEGKGAPALVPSPAIPASQLRMPRPRPIISPSSSSTRKTIKAPSPSPILTLPPPPPNHDCSSLTCTEPLTYAPAGSPCGCVWPVEVSLRLSVTLYTFFPLVSELAKEISAGLSLNRSQVRIMGANAVNQQLEKTIVLINLVPEDEQFDATTAFSIYRKFWQREIFVQTSLFGKYEVLYVHYPGLPPSPPSLTSASATINDQPNHGIDNDGMAIKPLGVDVPRRRKNRISRNVVIVIVLSCTTTVVVCMGLIWLLLLKCGYCTYETDNDPNLLITTHVNPAGVDGSLMLESKPTSDSMSFSSSVLQYTGTAKIFSMTDIGRATENFHASRVIGEGGFGIVYSGILDDGRKVAVKVLKRDDRQGSREFLAEVEMLSRLHHRNLVKLIGICTEAHSRCLVYELVPNGSVESHLHGLENEASPLDWCARMKIALGAARGLAYLHEDSSPRVIHRDFKSSNILLEHDFTAKVSDFGLARTALDERSKHISTHVMGTFGYLAPEYAMTGHLLVKSDVYSYGVVLLELLTGRKPVDLSQPPGQENLVAWARPLLTTNEGLETIIDPTLKPNASYDSVAKFAAIASMCVQPEVSHRPFMGEVVQALKLVCDEFDETRGLMSRSCSQDDFSIDIDSKHSRISGDIGEASIAEYAVEGVDSTFEDKIALSTNLVPAGFERQESGSFRRQFNSAPLKMVRKRRFWERLRGLSSGSMSEHGF
ncbi:receptor-like serine/threonine-protein kinase ALE2 [Coffea eugenioides]|uniref:Receptor-like serine/threonine-protein kinase ALE2 n=1 Tax=Coffea arabica TaxID=13443 RepID=A0A6P6XEF6_COFAR|nr:receptor-like serine/threonine-protein kinase ALE2 [Coffea arabica]XP_027168082.1 receptor-like serine/threonine-protein kinase ALE2 [Coffea eugenioides]